jgi:hypothetical protein
MDSKWEPASLSLVLPRHRDPREVVERPDVRRRDAGGVELLPIADEFS